MPTTRMIKLHDGLVVWPEYKPLADCLALKETTPDYIWESTYQGSSNPTRATAVFRREWWTGMLNRYNPETVLRPVARFISLDTASGEKDTAAYTAWTVGDMLPDYRLAIREMGRKHLDMPDLVKQIEQLYRIYAPGVHSCSIIIEDKSSGTGALQTLRKASTTSIPSAALVGYVPKVDKPTRWARAAVWCNLGCVLLPPPGADYPWLFDAEEELFNVPNARFLDQADSFAQLILSTEQYLSAGHNARSAKKE